MSISYSKALEMYRKQKKEEEALNGASSNISNNTIDISDYKKSEDYTYEKALELYKKNKGSYDTKKVNDWFNSVQSSFGYSDKLLENGYRKKAIDNMSQLKKDSEYVSTYINSLRNTEQYDTLKEQFDQYSNALNEYSKYARENSTVFSPENIFSDVEDMIKNPAKYYEKNQNLMYDFVMSDPTTKKEIEEYGGYNLIQTDNEKKYEELKKEYNSLGTDADSDIRRREIEKEWEDLEEKIEVDKQYKKLAGYEYKYKNLKSYDDFRNAMLETEDNGEKAWLREKAYNVGTSDDIQKRLEKLDADYNSKFEEIMNGDESDEKKAELVARLNKETEPLELELEKKKLEEKEQAEYTDIVNNNVRVRTVLDLIQNRNEKIDAYYNSKLEEIVHSDEPPYEKKVELVEQLENEFENLENEFELEEKELIESEYQKLVNEGYDMKTLEKWHKRKLEKIESEKRLEDLRRFADEQPALATIASVPLRTFGSIGDAVELTKAFVDKNFDGGDGYVNTSAFASSQASAIQEQVSSGIKNPIGQFFYNAGVSIADNIMLTPIALATGGVGEVAVLGLMANEALVSGATENYETTGDINKAMATGVAQGIAEALFEKVSLGNLKGIKKILESSNAITLKELAKQVGTSAGVEGLEEVFTSIANTVTDQIINGDQSQFSLQLQKYKDSGMTDEQASWAVAKDFAMQIGQDFLGGAFAGGILSGGVSGVNFLSSTNTTGQNIKSNENTENLINIGKTYGKDTKAYKLATELEKQSKNKSAQKVSSAKLSQLRSEIQNEAFNANLKAIDENFYEHTKNLTAEEKSAVKKMVDGETLSDNDIKIINKSKNAQKAISTYKVQGDTKSNNDYFIASASDKVKIINYDISKPEIKNTQKVSEEGKTVAKGNEIQTDNIKVERITPNKEVIYTTENGEVLKSKDIEWANAELATLNSYIQDSGFDVATANNYLQTYNEGQNVENYTSEYNLYNNYGRLALPLEEKRMNVGGTLTNEQKYSAYESGLNTRKAYYQQQQIIANAAKQSKNYGYRQGNFNDSAIKGIRLNETQKTGVNFLKMLSEVTGVNVELFRSGTNEQGVKIGENGSYNRNTHTLRVDIDAGINNINDTDIKHLILNTISHELTHIAELNPETYEELRSAVIKAIEKSGSSFEEMISHQKDIAKKYGQTLTDEQASREAIAEACENMLKDSEFIQQIVNENPSLWKKIINTIKALIEKIKKIMSQTSPRSEEGLALSKCIDELEDIQKLWDTAVKEGLKVGNAKNNTTTISESDNSYSIRYTTDNTPVAVIEDNILENAPKNKWIDVVKETIKSKYPEGIPISGRLVKVNLKTRNEYTMSKNTQYYASKNGVIYEDKFRSSNNLDDIVLASTNYVNENLKHQRKDSFKEFARGDVLIRVDKNDYQAKVIIGFTTGNNMILYDIVDFVPTHFKIRRNSNAFAAQPNKSESSSNTTVSTKNVSYNDDNVNNQYIQNSDEVRYSVRENFGEQVDNVLKNTYDKLNHVYMSNTPYRLVEILGLQKLPMLITNNHVYSMTVSENQAKADGRFRKGVHYHNLGANLIKSLPEELNKPAMIIKSNTNPKDGTFVVVTNLLNKQNRPVIVAIKPNGLGNYYNIEVPSNVFLSGYGKDNFNNFILKAKKENRILYVFKKSSQLKKNTPGVQFPNNIQSADYSNNLTQFKKIVNNIISENLKNDTNLFNADNNNLKLQDNSQHQYAGERADTANLSLLQQAEKMEQNGLDSETIRQETGWFKGYDNKWRFEVNDKDMTINQDVIIPKNGVELSGLIEHKSLFESYPELKNIKVKLYSMNNKGFYSSEDQTIGISTKFVGNSQAEQQIKELENSKEYKDYEERRREAVRNNGDWEKVVEDFENSSLNKRRNALYDELLSSQKIEDIDEVKTVLIHEIQHAIQNIEDFAKGSSVEYWNNIPDKQKPAAYEMAVKRYNQERSTMLNNASKDFLDKVQEYETARKNNQKDKVTELFNELAFSDEYTKRETDMFFGYLMALDNLDKYRGSEKVQDSETLYTQTAGEIEARDASSRADFTDEQRKNIRPDIDQADVVFANSNESYLINKRFNEQYDLWDKKNPRIKFKIGTTSNALKSIGISNKEIIWDSSKIIKIKSKHSEMTDDVIKQVPKILENPIVIMQSKTKANRLTMFGEVYIKENKPVLAVLELYPTLQGNIQLDQIKIASAYGKDNAQRFIDTSNVVYKEANKKRVTEWEKRTGLQLPVGESDGNSINSISTNINNVNNNDIQKTQKNEGKIKKDTLPSGKIIATFSGSKANSVSNDTIVTSKLQDVNNSDMQKSENDEQFQLRNDEDYSNRGLLANALESAAKTPREQQILRAYQEGVEKLDEKQKRLNDVKKQIKEISFTKGSNRSQLTKLNNQKKALSEQITRQDKSLLKLEAMQEVKNIIEVEKTRALDNFKKKYSEKVKEERQQRDEKIKSQVAEIRKDYQNRISELRAEKNAKIKEEHKKGSERVQKVRDARDVAGYVKKIKKLQKEFINLATKPTDTAYVTPELLNSGFFDACQAVTNAMILNDATKAGQSLRDVSDSIQTIKENQDSLLATEFDNDFKNLVDELAKHLKGKKINSKLTVTEAKDIYDTMSDIYSAIKNANKVLGIEEHKTIMESGNKIIEEQHNLDPSLFNRHFNLLKNYFMTADRMTAIYTGFNEDSELAYLFNEINKGNRKTYKFDTDAHKMFEEYTDGKAKELDRSIRDVVEVAYRNNKNQQKTTKITRMQGMQILMTWNREMQNKNIVHMQMGGIKLPDPELLSKGKFRKAMEKPIYVYGINQSFIDAVKNTMTDFEEGYIKVAEKYFNEVSKNAINETTRITKHRDVATESYYIPISVDNDALVTEIDGLVYDSRISGKGMLKSITKNSKKPITIVGLNSVINQHIKDTAQIYGLSIPIRNLNKVLNVKSNQFSESGILESSDSVKQAIKSNWGQKGYDLYVQLLTDLQTSRTSKNEKFQDINNGIRQVRSNFVTSTLFGNAPAVLRQAASYSAAGAYLSRLSLVKGKAIFATQYLRPGKLQELYDKIDAHTGQHYMRRKGMSSLAIEDIQNSWLLNNKLSQKLSTTKLVQKMPKGVNPVNWIQEMDCLTTAALWCATEEDVKSKYLKEGKEIETDEYWKEVTDLYDTVIEKTQPMYDPLHRPEVLKTSNEFIKSVFMFKTQPLQNAGIIWDAVGRLSQGNTKFNRKALRKAVFSQVRSLLVFASMSLAIGALMHKMDRYRDDEGELNLQSIGYRFAMDVLQNASGLVMPFGGTEIASQITSGSPFNSDLVTDNVVEQLNNMFTSFSDLTKTISEQIDGLQYGMDFDTQAVIEDLNKAVVTTLSGGFGLPVKNAENIVNAFVLWGQDIANGDAFSFNAGASAKKPVDYARSYGKLYTSGKTEEAKQKLDELYQNKLEEAKGKGEKDPNKVARNSVRTALQNAYKTDYQKAFLKGDRNELQRITKLLQSSSYMKWDDKTLLQVLSDWEKSAREDIQNKY